VRSWNRPRSWSSSRRAGSLPRHAKFTWDGGDLRVEPCEGASVAVNGQRVADGAVVHDGDWVVLGSSAFQASLRGRESSSVPVEAVTAAPRSTDPSPTVAVESGARPELSIGRLPESDIYIDAPIVSRRHARLVRRGGDAILEDLASTNGTYVNGARIDAPVILGSGDRVAFGSFAFTFDGATLHEFEGAGQIRVEVRKLTKTVRDAATGAPKALLRDVSLAIEPGEFVGIFGTSGSGKSTLLDSMNGRRPASQGAVVYNGADLARYFDEFRASIGYVPQQDIVHRKITIRRALGYAARLRLPPDTSQREIDEYTMGVLERVGLSEKADQPIDTPSPLSGGQLKRVSLAVELVSNPAIIFLDEVTSGLDAGTDKRMMGLFADLAREQKTIVCVTHTLENIDVCGLVALLHEGRLVFFGPPAAALDHFELSRLSEVYEVLESAPADSWADRYEASDLHRTYVRDRIPAGDDAGTPESTTVVATSGGSRLWRQAGILTRRYVDLIASDRRNLAILLLQAPLIGLVIGLVFDTSGSPAQRASAESQVSFMIAISAIWFGCLNSAREVVKELPVYLRERAINLRLAPYLLSKLGPLSVICVLQTTALLVTVSLLLDLSGSFAGRAAALIATGLAATAMGLTVSALVNSNDKAVATVPVLLIPQIVLSDAIVDLSGASELFAKVTMISYWAFAAMCRSLDPGIQDAVGPLGQQVILVDVGYGASLAMLGLLFGVFALCSGLALKLKDRRV
jgi:ABC-type multidrug transport system ATPase subunit